MHERCLQKFPTAKKVWINYMKFLFENNGVKNQEFVANKANNKVNMVVKGNSKDEFLGTGRELVPKALKRLPTRKHV